MVQSMRNTKHEKEVTDSIGAVYAKIRIEWLWLIEQDVVYHEKQIG